jgi:hypothetical protein
MDQVVAAAARDLLKNPAFKAICSNLEDRYTRSMVRTEPHQREEREQAYLKLRALIDFLRELRGLWETSEAEEIAAARKVQAAESDL